MPILPENKARYPKEWPLISLTVRELAGWRCEWCAAEQGKPHPISGSKVVLTVAHLDHTPENCADPDNLKALCQRCHLRYDREHHAKTRRARREAISRSEEPAAG
jgi:5-methylcytosine-specific restriction endonuclease McrA